MNIGWLFLFFVGITFGPVAVAWVFDRIHGPRRAYIRGGIADAEAYANTAGIPDAEFEAEWVRWLEEGQ